MKAAVYHKPYDVTGEEVDKPQAGPGEILVRMKACGICGSDLHTYRLGLFLEISKEIPQGRIPGHEFAGDVVEVGDGVEGIAVGDRVMALAVAGMAEYVVVTPAMLNLTVFKLPPEVSYEEGATLEPMATSLHCAKLGAPAKGEQVVVFGAGIIGLGIVQSLKAFGVDLNKIIVVDAVDYRLETAKKVGATDVINAVKENVFEKVMELAGQAPPIMLLPTVISPNVDLVYDAVGYIKDNPAPPVLEQAMLLTREWGRIAVVGVYEGAMTMDPMAMVAKQIKVQGSYAYNLPDELLESLELIRTKKVDRKVLITHEFPLEKAKEAFETQANAGASVKVVFKT
ncbi:MAG: zinc-binding dehydrogenase [Deltaproteobacteria bacterium]|nr:zinc-binding dehydrogenase [Deltaproteobacteria bacterium]